MSGPSGWRISRLTNTVAEDNWTAPSPENGSARPGATPAPERSSSNAEASTSTAPIDVKPESPAVPARRKRQKITYVPLHRPMDSYGGWDIAGTEEMMTTVNKRKPQRQAMDLGRPSPRLLLPLWLRADSCRYHRSRRHPLPHNVAS